MGLMIEGLGIVLVGLAPANVFWLAVSGMFVAGSMNALVNGPLFALLQAIVAPEMQGRVFTVVGSLCSAMMPLSLAIAGPVADAIGLRSWYVVSGVVCTLLGLAACFVPVIVNIEQNHNAAKPQIGLYFG